MQIAITGATGFVGRYLVYQLAGAGHRLRCWHRKGSDRSGFGRQAKSIEWLSGELGNASAVSHLVQGVDALVHAAVQWEGPRSRGHASHGAPDVFFGINLVGSLQLFQAALEAGTSRCIFISTCAVHEVILDDRLLDETHPLWPTSHYGAHKAALEKFVHSFGLGQGWQICALRPTGIYGVAHPPQKSRWFDLVGQVLRNEPISSTKGGKEVHAVDVAAPAESCRLRQAPAARRAYVRHLGPLMDRLDGFLDRLTDVLYGPGPYIALRWKLAPAPAIASSLR
jgi:nucleoside-diphosphate-sugar epimerase